MLFVTNQSARRLPNLDDVFKTEHTLRVAFRFVDIF